MVCKYLRSGDAGFCRPSASPALWYPVLPLPWERGSQVQLDELQNPLWFLKQISLTRAPQGAAAAEGRWARGAAAKGHVWLWGRSWGRFWGKSRCLAWGRALGVAFAGVGTQGPVCHSKAKEHSNVVDDSGVRINAPGGDDGAAKEPHHGLKRWVGFAIWGLENVINWILKSPAAEGVAGGLMGRVSWPPVPWPGDGDPHVSPQSPPRSSSCL